MRIKTIYLIYDRKEETYKQVYGYGPLMDVLGFDRRDETAYSHVGYALRHGTPIKIEQGKHEGRYFIAKFHPKRGLTY